METETETAQQATTFGPPDADYEGLADAPDTAFEEQDDDADIDTPDDGEPDDLA